MEHAPPSATQVTTLLTLLLLLVWTVRRYRRRRRSQQTRPDAPSAVRAPLPKVPYATPARVGTLRLADVAVAYERAVIGLSDVGEVAKLRALSGLSEAIIPLTGSIGLDELTPALEAGIACVLADEAELGDEWVVHLWHDFVRWGRSHRAHVERSILLASPGEEV